MYVAHSTEELSNLACLVAMVYDQSAIDIRRALPTQIALIFLFLNHLEIVFIFKIISLF